MVYLDGRESVKGITSFGTVNEIRQNSDNLFKNFWTAKEFVGKTEGLKNVGGSGWIGGVSQVVEHVIDPLPSVWQQTSLLSNLLQEKLIKEKVNLLPIHLRDGKIPPGVWAKFDKEPLIDYGMWLAQVYHEGKGIQEFSDLGNNTYQGKHYYPPTNLSQEKLGSTMKGLIQKGMLKKDA